MCIEDGLSGNKFSLTERAQDKKEFIRELHVTVVLAPPGMGDSAYERGGDARRKFWIKETDLGVAQAFFDP